MFFFCTSTAPVEKVPRFRTYFSPENKGHLRKQYNRNKYPTVQEFDDLLSLECFQGTQKKVLLTYFRNARKYEALAERQKAAAKAAAAAAAAAAAITVPDADAVQAPDAQQDVEQEANQEAEREAEPEAVTGVTTHVTIPITVPATEPGAAPITTYIIIPAILPWTVPEAVPYEADHLSISPNLSEDPDMLHESSTQPTTHIHYNTVHDILRDCFCEGVCVCSAT